MDSHNILCVCLSESGKSFWTDQVAALSDGSLCVVAPSSDLSDMPSLEELQLDKIVFIDTMKTVLVPSELYAEGGAEHYLTLNNIEIEPNEQVIVSSPIHDTISIVVCNKEALKALKEHLGAFSTASPMQYNLMCAAVDRNIVASMTKPYRKYAKKYNGKFTTLYSTSENIYLSVFDRSDEFILARSLLISEVVPLRSSVDALYYLNWLDSRFSIRRRPVYVKGIGACNILGAVEGKFKKSQCE